jgi:Mannosyltransferase (PIG-V)
MGAGMRRDGIPAAVLEPVARARPRAGLVREAALAEALGALWFSRLLVWASGAGAAALFGLSARVQLFDPGAVTRPFGPAGNALVAPLARWDSVWYLAIANDGYPAGDPRRAAFFPLYPLLVRAAKAFVGSPIVAGAAVSLVCFAVALVLLHRLTALELGPAAADETVWALALFPAAVFFSAVYSEALYLMLSIGAIYAARTGRWAWAGTLGVLGAATRSAGVLLVVPLGIMWLARADGRLRRRGRDAAWIALVPAGLAAFCAALALGGGDAFAPLHAQDVWFRRFAGPFVGIWDGAAATLRGLHHLDAPYARADIVLFCFLVLAVPAVVGVVRRLPPAYGGYVVAALALPLSYPVGPQPLMSLPRFLAVLFPLFMWLGAWMADGGRARRVAVLAPSAAGLVAATAVFSTWHWFA